jgi:hypothetical protein
MNATRGIDKCCILTSFEEERKKQGKRTIQIKVIF